MGRIRGLMREVGAREGTFIRVAAAILRNTVLRISIARALAVVAIVLPVLDRVALLMSERSQYLHKISNAKPTGWRSLWGKPMW